MVVFGQSVCIWAKVVVLWQICSIRAKLVVLGKLVVFGQNWLFLAIWLYFGKIGSIRLE